MTESRLMCSARERPKRDGPRCVRAGPFFISDRHATEIKESVDHECSQEDLSVTSLMTFELALAWRHVGENDDMTSDAYNNAVSATLTTAIINRDATSSWHQRPECTITVQTCINGATWQLWGEKHEHAICETWQVNRLHNTCKIWQKCYNRNKSLNCTATASVCISYLILSPLIAFAKKRKASL